MDNYLLMGRLPGELILPTKHRVPFLYLEYGRVLCETNSVIFQIAEEECDLPVAQLSAILLGSGTSITQQAVAEIARHNCNLTFCYGARIEVHASFLSGSTTNARLLERQVQLRHVRRAEIARKMYAARRGITASELSGLTINEMRGTGARFLGLYFEREL